MSQWIRACSADDVDEEDVIPFTHEGVEYAIYRSPDDGWFATEGRCSHGRVLLCDGLVMDSVIECPKHNGRFDYTTGRALAAPVTVDLRTYATRIEGGEVFVDIDSAGGSA